MEWIALEDKIPGLCVDILFTDGKQIYMGWIETDPCEDPVFVAKTIFADEDDSPENVTHWMKLPSLPGKEKCAALVKNQKKLHGLPRSIKKQV